MDTMKNRTLYIFFIAATALFSLQSCSLEELDAPVSGGAGQTYIEFIARATSYNKTDVATKSAVSDIESAVYNAFLLVFDDAGTRIMCKEITDPTVTPSASIPIDKGLSSVTACFLINVPSSFANGIKGLTKPTNDATALDNEYINTAVLSGISYGTGANFGLPYIDLDGPAEGSRPAVACIPMFGMEEINLNSSSAAAQITVKRLFAKITVDLKLDMNLSDWNNLIQTYTYLQLNYYELKNVPNRVRLIESTDQSAWVTDPDSDAFITTEISSGPINKQIYNQDSNTSNNKTCVFEFYAPEYYLNRATEWTNDEKSKPNNKPTNAKAIYLFLDATYSQYSLTTTDLQYEIYLGRDAISDFSLARNVNYINSLTVVGVDESDVDHRVTTTVINNPVAKEGKAANCYIIGKTGDYYFPAYKGAYNDLTKAVLCSNPNAELVELVNDNDDNIVLQDLVYDADRNIVSFKVSEIADGNVVIARVDDKDTDNTADDEIEWSWHLWCNLVDDYDVLGWGVMGTQTYPNGTYTLHDRNIGASPNDLQLLTPGIVSGCYYNFGHKEPFINGNYVGGGVNGTFTWDADSDSNIYDDVKSVYDPCPPGYHVPISDVLSGEATETHAGDIDLGQIRFTSFRYWDNNTATAWDGGLGYLMDDIYFPYTGYLDGNKSPVNSNVDTTPLELNADDYTPLLTPNYTESFNTDENYGSVTDRTWWGTGYKERDVTYTEHRYSEFIYEVKLTTSYLGRLWMGDNHYYNYGSKTNEWEGYNIKSCKHETRTVTRRQQQELLAGRVVIDWHFLDLSPAYSSWVADPNRLTGTSSVPSSSLSTVNNSTWRSNLKSHQNNRDLSRSFGDNVSFTTAPNIGCQVRCVVDPTQDI